MSGTSLDGIDAGLVDFSHDKPRLIGFHYQAYSASLRHQIQLLSQADTPILLKDYGALDSQLGHLFAEACLTLLQKSGIPAADINAIGSHGQTVYHAPDGKNGFSLQIGDPNRIAQITGITTIGDFRRRDIAVGGQGAPLVPAFHHALFSDPTQITSVVNIGGIANISILNGTQVLGFDTGPGNTLMDYWCELNLGHSYDANGDWAAIGNVQAVLLQQFLDDDYFRQSPPKSTGKEYFSPAWLNAKLASTPKCKVEDIQATLCQLTADSIADAILEHAANSKQVLLCGGGAHNQQLVSMLGKKLPMLLASTAAFGIDPDHVEAMAFAWLARQTFHQLTGNLCSVTGANEPVILGGLYPGNCSPA